MDNSGKLDAARRAAAALLDEFGPDDRVAIIAFKRDKSDVLGGLTALDGAGRAQADTALAGLAPGGPSCVYDAVAAAYDLFPAASAGANARAIILLTDGPDEAINPATQQRETCSKTTPAMLVQTARAASAGSSGITLYAVGLGERAELAVLGELTAAAGGEAEPSSVGTLVRVFQQLARAL